MSSQTHDLRTHPLHLGLGAKAVAQPAFTGMEWYAAYTQRTAQDGTEGRLVSLYDFSDSWDSWEMHPAGDEVVLCLAGEMTVIQEYPDGRLHSEMLAAGQYIINPPGVWHTADVAQNATALFITAGAGTQHRPR
ncbi:cupin domain-containing protein [Novosphingobium sp. Leaf2]|uniref:cupin domain-containing protein n=1 Tax=Novosphingobium sp. Leaf2 TaxID=1735670 RepID=UPI0007016427|nr:cupin [Novosphingobium sp. Leaf2]KQM21391.1 cupin [Novosphingobium sp. Leaf2]